MVTEVLKELAATLALYSSQAGDKNTLVAAVEELVSLDPFPSCATCPAAFWYWDTELACFCKVRKDDTWGGNARAVIACAEREDLLTLPLSADI